MIFWVQVFAAILFALAAADVVIGILDKVGKK